MSFPDLDALLRIAAPVAPRADVDGLTATFGYIGSAIVLLGLAWVVILAIRRYLRAPKD
jgi:hypothetical protein